MFISSFIKFCGLLSEVPVLNRNGPTELIFSLAYLTRILTLPSSYHGQRVINWQYQFSLQMEDIRD